MKFCTGALKKMAEIMVEERNKIGANGLGIHEVETRLCELVREVGVQVLGMEDEPLWERGVDCECGEAMSYLCKRPATIVSVFARVS